MQLFDQQAGNDPSRRFALGSQNPNFLNMQRDTIVKPIQFTVPENIQNDTHKIQNPRFEQFFVLKVVLKEVNLVLKIR